MQIAKTKKQAKELGLSRYFTGKPCCNGHLSERDIYGRCMKCGAERSAQYKKENPLSPEQREQKKDYLRKYRDANRDALNEKQRTAYELKRAERLKAKRISYWADPCKMRERASKSRIRRLDKISQYMKLWRAKNRELINKNLRERIQKDPFARCASRMRGHLHRVMKATGEKKKESTRQVLGYTQEELKAHIERQFSKGMRWDNYGKWHIDHIVPVSLMVKSGHKDPAVINALSNLRPLWAAENQSKASKAQYLI